MPSIFLSASVPVSGRGDFHEDADPFLIQFAVRELLTLVLGRRHLIWGGHPAITPMVWSVCEDLGVEYASAVTLYQSLHFEDYFPRENARFGNSVFTAADPAGATSSVDLMRQQMLDNDFEAGVFIGGMEGVLVEHNLFREKHSDAAVVVVGAGGGAARQLARQQGEDIDRIDFLSLFSDRLSISPVEPRMSPDDVRFGTTPF